MIKIYKQKLVEEVKPQQKLKISEKDIQLELLFDTAKENKKAITVSYEDIQQNLKYAVLFSYEGYSPFVVDESHDIFSSDSAAVFIFKSSNDDIIIQCRLDTEIDKESSEYEEDNENIPDNFRLAMGQYYDDYAEYINKVFYHNAFIEAVNNKTTLAYLDAQVELISSILLKILDKHPELISDIDMDFATIKTAFDNTSLLNIKSMDKILDEIHTNKQYVRELQKQYYELKESEASKK